LDTEEEENMRKINEKREELEKLRKDITDCRMGGTASMVDSGSSIRSSPPTEKSKKTLGLFKKG